MRIKISHTKSGSGNDNNEYLNTIDKVQKYMTNYCFTVPFLPGGIELARKWNQENIVNNKEHDEVFNEAGISREQVWIQHLPQGDFAVVSYETDNPEQSFKVLATSDEPWAVKFREHLKKGHDLDIAQSSSIMQPNEQIINWKK
jgi:hypothetical protein